MADMSYAGLAPTQDERTMATLAHALQLIGSWIAPLIIFLVKRQSRFVSFHALQALLFQVCYTILVFMTVAGWFALTFSTLALHFRDKTAPPTAFFAFFPLIWLLFAGCGILNLVIAIVYAIKAGQGEWAEYPFLGRLARKMLRMGPGGAQLSGQA
jgi:uncharacterized Tic20 family protein